MTFADRASLPVVIQGGMGVGISSWQLARAVARTGQLGVVSGTALDAVVARRLQDGDPAGDVQRALAAFPIPGVAERVRRRYFKPGGRDGAPYAPIPRLSLHSTPAQAAGQSALSHSARAGDELTIVGNFVEVWLAKEGHEGLVGINFLEKIQMATPAAAYGAMLAGVDYVLMGAGIPREIPHLLDELAEHRPGTVMVDVAGGDPLPQTLDPAALLDPGQAPLEPLHRPMFLAIVSSHVLAQYLNREDSTRPDGYVVEGPRAGGHNAPPRGRLQLDEIGQPVYGPRDDANLAAMAEIGLPFWLAGGYGEPERVKEALDAGAAGVQVGTLFALAEESGLEPHLREQVLSRLSQDQLEVLTDASASPTGFPFKVAQLPGTLSDQDLEDARPRQCDLGYLRQPYLREAGAVGYRCPAEPADVYARKGGSTEGTDGAKCLCNALMADIGLAQTRREGYTELPLVTLGADLAGARQLCQSHQHRANAARPSTQPSTQPSSEPATQPSTVVVDGWSAVDAVQWLLSSVGTRP